MTAVDIFHHASLFLFRATPDDIEAERSMLEAQYKMKLKVFSVEPTTRSGAPCTRVMWEME